MTAHISVPYSKQVGVVVRGVLIPPADGHQHLVEVSEALAKGESAGPNYGRTAVTGGHSHAWYETPTGIAFEPADGHTHPPVVMSDLLRKQTVTEAMRERETVGEQLDAITLRLVTEIRTLERADVEDDEFPQRLLDIQRMDEFAQSLADKEGLDRDNPGIVDEAHALIESVSTKRDTNMITPQDFHKDSRDAAALLDEVVEKARGEGETYAAATNRLAYEPSPEGQTYRRLAKIADEASRAASVIGSEVYKSGSVSGHFVVREQFPDGTARVDRRISKAEDDLDELAKRIQADEGCDYYDAYAKAAERRPDLYVAAVG